MSGRRLAVANPPSHAPDKGDVPNQHTRTRSTNSINSSTHTQSSRSRNNSTHPDPNPNSSPRAEKGAEGTKWLRSLTSWLTIAEPSVQALKHHREDVFRKAGIPDDDPDAGRKLHVPVGEIPPHAVRPAGKGRDPEDLLRERRRKERARKDSSGSSAASPQSMSSSALGSGLSQGSRALPEKRTVQNEIFPFN